MRHRRGLSAQPRETTTACWGGQCCELRSRPNNGCPSRPLERPPFKGLTLYTSVCLIHPCSPPASRGRLGLDGPPAAFHIPTPSPWPPLKSWSGSACCWPDSSPVCCIVADLLLPRFTPALMHALSALRSAIITGRVLQDRRHESGVAAIGRGCLPRAVSFVRIHPRPVSVAMLCQFCLRLCRSVSSVCFPGAALSPNLVRSKSRLRRLQCPALLSAWRLTAMPMVRRTRGHLRLDSWSLRCTHPTAAGRCELARPTLAGVAAAVS